MNPEQIMLVQSSFAQVVPIADTAAVLFYQRLFTLDPSLRVLFKGDIAEQRQKLMTMLGVAVKGLSRLDEIVPAVQQLGRRHAGYGVQGEHYETVGAALLWTLGQGLGAGFTPRSRRPGSTAYTLLAGTMRTAAADATGPLLSQSASG